jgi:hypothetical protein
MDDSQIVLFADFDSGNMARYERVNKQAVPNQSTNGTPVNSTNNAASNSSNTTSVNGNSAETTPNPAPQPTSSSNSPLNQPKFDVEFNVWTKPDCYGTPVGPNGNR